VRRFVRGRKWQEEEAAAGALFRAFGTSFAGDRLLRGVGLESPVNVSVHPFGERLLAFGEQGLPWRLDPATLETLGEETFGGALNQISPFSAHPRFDPVSGEMVAFGVSFAAREPVAQLYRFGPEGDLRLRARVPIGLPASVHDFAISQHFAVWYVAPYLLDFAKMRDGASVLEALEWKPELGSRVVVARREDGGVVAEIAVGQGYCLHTVDAHEPGDGTLVLDLIELERPVYDSYLLETLLADAPRGRPTRLVLDLEQGKVLSRRELGFDLAPDFPAIDPRRATLGAEELWLLGMSRVGQGGKTFFDRLAHLSWDGRVDVWAAPEHHYLAAEPVFVAGPDDAAVVLCPVLDTQAQSTSIAAFVADQVAAGPVATVACGGPLTPGFHATWWPGGG
jgi:carotenoid cleavage dioxygenase-like enzyme